MPRGTLVLGPFDHFEFTVSAGNGVRSVDPSYVAQGLLTPFVSVESQDLGVSYNNQLGTVNLAAKSVFFHTHADQDLLFDPDRRDAARSRPGRRAPGGRAPSRALGSFFDVAANATLVKATFDDIRSLLVPYVPDLVLRADAAVFHDLPWQLDHKPVRGTIGYGVSYVGRRPLPYSELSDVIFISDASAGVGWSIFNVRLSAQNLFNSKYKLGEYNYASDFHSQARAHARPRALVHGRSAADVMLSLSATLGGAS